MSSILNLLEFQTDHESATQASYERGKRNSIMEPPSYNLIAQKK